LGNEHLHAARMERYWCRREGHFRIDSCGFLLDPEGEFRNTLNPELIRLPEVADTNCLILLGEPGMGKTTALEAERERWGQSIGTTGDVMVWRDLAEYGDEARLIRDLFETSEWDSWRSSDLTLHLFLDSLDECRLNLPNISAIILGQLRRLPQLNRLKLRIACRTGAWPHYLEEGLRGLWPGDRTDAFELVPLRRRDVAEIASGFGLENVEAFLREVELRNAGPMAAKPVTLKLLANLYIRGGQLPSTQAELYERGCRALCEETSLSRQAAGRHGVLGPEQRLAVAARIAAATVFCARTAVWDGPDLADQPEDDISVTALSGWAECVSGGEFAVSEGAVREVLSDTGLFSSRGPRRMGWAHRTFAEYLASRYLVERVLAVGQIESLIWHPHMPGRVVPQLHEVAAWIAGTVPDVFRAIMKSDPGVLVRSDVENTAADDREALVAALLASAAENRLGDLRRDARSEYRKLKHPLLAEQLRPFIVDKSRSLESRWLAIEVAQACEVLSVQEDLVEVALDRSDDMTVRVEAGYAVCAICEDSTRRRMRSLLAQDLDEDTGDELKGCALRSLWPGLFSAEELFRVLTPPKRQHNHGAYAGFLSGDLLRGLTQAELPVAVGWASAQKEPGSLGSVLGWVVDQIVLRACNEIDGEGILDALAGVVWSRLEAHVNVIGSSTAGAWSGCLPLDAGNRRKLIRVLIPKLTAASLEPTRLVYSGPPLVVSDDTPWLIGLLDLEHDGSIRATIARLVRSAFLLCGTQSPDPLLEAAQRHPELADAIRDLTSPVELNSPEATAARNQRARKTFYERSAQQVWTLDPPPQERILRLLSQAEAGDPDAWWQLTLVMTLEPTSKNLGETFRSGLTTLPGWREADANTRAMMLNAAHRYVVEYRPSPDEWFYREGITYHPDEAGFKALRLLNEEAQERFATLGADVWSKWAPAIIGYPASGRDDDEEAQRRLVAVAHRQAPDEILSWLARWLAEQNSRDYPLITTRSWADISGPGLTAVLMKTVRDPTTKFAVMEALLNDLLTRNIPDARAYATSLLSATLPEGEGPCERFLTAARSLLTCAPDAGWPVIWPLLQQSPESGRDVILSVASRFNREGTTPFLSRLSEGQVADFFVWLARHFPHDRDEDHGSVHAVGPREYVERLRDGVLRHLEQRGTLASLGAIKRITGELPSLPWLASVYLEAEKVMLERTWMPHQPEHLWKLVRDREARLVEGGDQLLAVVIESLRRYEGKLQGETPASFTLWDKQAGGRYRPKEEERISDALKLHLVDDLRVRGIVANREVVIRSGSGGKSGERTDIHVDAITRGSRPGAFDQITVVIEVKGCWNRDVMEAMQIQLKDRYLSGGACHHGLYVVGWFLCDQWDPDDYRRSDTRGQLPPSKPEAQAVFAAQAERLSGRELRLAALVIDIALR